MTPIQQAIETIRRGCHELIVQVTSVLTTANGRLVFSRPVGEPVPMNKHEVEPAR